MNRPKILIALFRFPYPVTDGTRYKILKNVIEGLSQEYDLEFLIATIETYSTEQIHYLNRWGNVQVFYKPKISFMIDMARSVFSKLPLQVSGFFDPGVARWVREHIEQYHAVYVHEIRMSEYFAHLPEEVRKKCVLDFNDAISYNYELAAKVRRFPYNIIYKFEATRVRKYESKMLATFYRFNVVSSHDKDILLKNAKIPDNTINFVSIPHGIELPTQQASLVSSKNILFLGNLDYAPNRDALSYFFNSLWKPLCQIEPQLSIHIIGKGRHTVEGKNIFYHGYVSDLYTVIKDTSLLIAPIRIGAGTPSKIIDAMSYGLPVLTTPIGAAGVVGAVDGKNIIIYEVADTEGWVTAVKKILTDESYRKTIGGGARILIEDQYSCEHSQQALLSLFRAI